MTEPKKREYLTIEQLAGRFNLKVRVLEDLIPEGLPKMPFNKSNYRYEEDEVRKWVYARDGIVCPNHVQKISIEIPGIAELIENALNSNK